MDSKGRQHTLQYEQTNRLRICTTLLARRTLKYMTSSRRWHTTRHRRRVSAPVVARWMPTRATAWTAADHAPHYGVSSAGSANSVKRSAPMRHCTCTAAVLCWPGYCWNNTGAAAAAAAACTRTAWKLRDAAAVAALAACWRCCCPGAHRRQNLCGREGMRAGENVKRSVRSG